MEEDKRPWPQRALQWIFDWHQERLVFLWCYFDAPSSDDFALRMEKEAELLGIKRGEAVVRYVSAIEIRATALLQHISVMLALTIFYLAYSEGSKLLNFVLLIEVVGYLWAALACLRCLLQVSSAEWMRNKMLVNELVAAYELEALKREVIYRHAMQVLVALTLVLAGSIVLHSVLSII